MREIKTGQITTVSGRLTVYATYPEYGYVVRNEDGEFVVGFNKYADYEEWRKAAAEEYRLRNELRR